MSVLIGHALKQDKKYSTVPTSGSQGGWIWRKKILKKQILGLHEAKILRCSLAVMPRVSPAFFVWIQVTLLH